MTESMLTSAKALCRFWKKVEKTPECWIWKASKNCHGYGKFWTGEREIGAHRFSYFLANGSLDKEKVIDHKCRNRACVNPDHLREVTHRINCIKNSTSPPAINSLMKKCKRGHEFSHRDANGKRACKECMVIRTQKYQKGKEEKIKAYNKEYYARNNKNTQKTS